MESIYNSDIIKKASDILGTIGNEITKIGEAVTQIESNSSEFAGVMEELLKKLMAYLMNLLRLKEKFKMIH